MNSNIRILSLDLFRGFTVAGMILVNNPGSWSYIYSPLKHAQWNGCTPTDLVFPFFLFAVGVSIPVSFRSKMEVDRVTLLLRIIKRSASLFFIGLFLNFFGEWSLGELRIPGVLQRIAFVYLVLASVFLFLPDKKILILTVPILLGHTWLLTQVAAPGADAVSLEPGRDIGAWIDRSLFGVPHLWKFSKTWDPEGFLSGVSSLSSSLFGVLCGLIFSSTEKTDFAKRVGYFFGIGALLLLCGLLWGLLLPMNKSLWTGSYSVYTAGLAFVCVGCFEFLYLWNHRMIRSDPFLKLEFWFQPFLVYGKNAILVFAGSGIIARILNVWTIDRENGKSISIKGFLYSKLLSGFDPYDASLVYAFVWVVFWWAILTFLDRKRFYIKL
ncbi:DUF5009 domain-containing protein [Leptospira gomenensis]|uniref:DUF5009 domain-containing protein n=1 Tax=Leptospira gomenensis TaxID=2484974 RepID=A0A5F1YJG0_9LEPT|nr:DUF5009 domain-containing protein [Leptospira gomenensis]TGK34504.1 DUF5009 domain-containing protein [Leptospira gomenensis]TGK40186.1 DUF5009 domain-containing protein [Leptospira gomenensis]TGK41889.1 DUF5009 domain-containing protein [Leptospira gomenensis]TGK55695.1 DUF5009 domain-containing protein [Leptospira gomenensis]